MEVRMSQIETLPRAEALFAGRKAGLYAGYVTENLAETKDFFVAKLGFAVAFESDWFALLKLQDSEQAGQIGLLAPAQEGQSNLFRKPYPGHGAWITFDVADVDAIHARAVAAGIPIAVPLRDEPWGERHFSVVAPNGLALDFVTYQGALAEA
jgi:catechol 2,3-dioxygenase-like lactoylglutathione lyase family enzyme